ncbi:MAG: hypothetical protein Q8Q13_02100 [bacterium]|nr:hypothetical protein [bacterium]
MEQPEEAAGAKIVATRQFPLHWVLLASTAIAILASFYIYFFTKNYDFLIEAPCDAALSQCYVRDCSTGDCPPNNLSAYSLYRVPAALFSSCTDNSCSNICTAGNTVCKEIPCSSQVDVECSGPRAFQ